MKVNFLLKKEVKKNLKRGKIMNKEAKGSKVKVHFQGLHMTPVIHALVYNLK
jgi:hypothetical protein